MVTCGRLAIGLPRAESSSEPDTPRVRIASHFDGPADGQPVFGQFVEDAVSFLDVTDSGQANARRLDVQFPAGR